ncbi:ABC transporter ATP-binding protein [Agrococcus sp. ARC_14]|uniref:ABC transporter ATP-binding protein n=1 Tax=Agrococcus sp. ARC_14 TaxID=2919927 RepID=UPI001F05259F|nr:ABC transporter ATP-binding protein [Agrococcus sp. ARC_14]MCH1881574.1 ABC transporter ATP-binding protein [Agrococcus sp. ARC_14]
MSDPQQPEPTRRQKLKPFEYLVFAGGVGIFVGLVILLAVRDITLTLIFGGVGFIATLLLTATLMLAVKPKGRSAAELDKREGFDQ